MRIKLNLSNILRLSSFTIGFILSNEAFSQSVKCTLNGDYVNPNHGGTTAGKTGMVICKNDEGKVTREYELREGKEIGKRVRVDSQGNREEYSVNEKGNMDGLKKVFNKDGKLTYEGRYKNSDGVGLHKEWFDSGKLKSIHYENKMSIDFKETEEPYNIRCSKEEAFTSEDKEICGWKKPYESTVGRSKLTYSKGHLIKEIEHNRDGKIQYESVVEEGIETQKRYFESGEIKSISTFKGREPLTTKEYFMNGNVSKDMTFNMDDKFLKKSMKTFYDDKTLESEGTYIVMRNYDQPDGELKSYWPDSKPKNIEIYKEGKYEGEAQYFDDKGQLISKRTYANDVLKREIVYKENVMVSDFEYLPDGSRKLNN
jgi:antitoxin component YwqK of YwqJK toxin-antitoxin module